MQPLTAKQLKVLKFIESRLRENSPPSQREIANHFKLAQNAAYQIVSYLKQKSYLTNTSTHRGLRLSNQYLQKIKETEGIPILGRVAAGEPILAEQNIEGYADLNEILGPTQDKFILKVTGDSMVDAGIMDGDYVVVKPTETIENGQIGVVLLDNEATVKRIYIHRDRVMLKPANKAAGYKPQYVKQGKKNIYIVGKVTGCFRKL
jgi:repressor LexA